MDENVAILLLPLSVIVGGIVVVAMGLYQRTKVLEMAHRERLAMIERGMAPPAAEPEFSRGYAGGHRPAGGQRSMTLGILFIGFGLGLGMLIGFAAGAPDAAAGVGGAIAILGAALVVNAVVKARALAVMPPPRPTTGEPAAGRTPEEP